MIAYYISLSNFVLVESPSAAHSDPFTFRLDTGEELVCHRLTARLVAWLRQKAYQAGVVFQSGLMQRDRWEKAKEKLAKIEEWKVEAGISEEEVAQLYNGPLIELAKVEWRPGINRADRPIDPANVQAKAKGPPLRERSAVWTRGGWEVDKPAWVQLGTET